MGFVSDIFGKDSSPPPAPDYAGAATAQGAANLEAARATGRINNPNVNSIYGSQNVTWDGDTPTLTQTLSPEQQALYQKQVQAKGLLGDLSVSGANALKGIVGTGVDFAGMPGAPGSAEETRTKAINALMGRVDEDTTKTRDQANSDLIAAGIRPGTKAYADRMALIDRGYNDARQQAFLAGGQEASRDFGIDTQRRKDAIAEYLTQRQTPLNEVNALQSGSQVSNPFAVPGYAQNAQAAPAPVFNAAMAQGSNAMNQYNAEQAQQQAMMQGLFSLGGAALGAPTGTFRF